MDFNDDEIGALLEKYFDGETSLGEERQLENYFNASEVSPAFVQFKPLFAYFRGEKEVGTSAGFEERMLQKISAPGKPPVKIIRLVNSAWISAAATVMILLGSWWFYHQPETGDRISSHQFREAAAESRDTYSDPRQAMATVEKALMTVSGNMQHGATLTRENLAKLNSLDKVMQ
jgi:hypothetical protein